MRGALVNILKYHECDRSRDELVAMFNRMKTTSKEPDRFHYIRCWNGTNEVEPVVLTSGLVEMPTNETATNDTARVEVLLPASSQLKESVEN
jgi:hypothetical protein